MRKEPVKDRLVKHIDYVDDCWLWTAAKNNSGYGMIRHGTKMITAHRASYESFVGPIPEGKNVCHTCDNISCINPNHLLPLTHQENYTRRLAERRKFGRINTK